MRLGILRCLAHCSTAGRDGLCIVLVHPLFQTKYCFKSSFPRCSHAFSIATTRRHRYSKFSEVRAQSKVEVAPPRRPRVPVRPPRKPDALNPPSSPLLLWGFFQLATRLEGSGRCLYGVRRLLACCARRSSSPTPAASPDAGRNECDSDAYRELGVGVGLGQSVVQRIH